MKAVILAAGLGKRLGISTPKCLVKVAGREIIYRTMNLLSGYVDEFIVVVNKKYEKIIREKLENFRKFKYKIVVNTYPPELGNGYSLYVAKKFVNEKFILVMGDHIFDKSFIEEAVKGEGLIVDRSGLFIDRDEATKIKVVNGKAVKIGKELKKFDYYDTGFFVLTKDIFRTLEMLVKAGGKVEINNLVEKAKMKCYEVSGYFWMDIDTKEDLKKAKKHLVRRSIKKYGDGFIARYLNRRISVKISEILVDHITPNEMTALSTIVGIISSFLVFINVGLASVIYQFSSILDGCDGEIARASMRESKIGGYMDSVLDRYVDFLFLVCIIATLKLDVLMLVISFFAIFGSAMISYSTERYKAAFFEDIYSKIRIMRYLPGKRDERIFVIMIFCIFGLLKELIVFLAIWTNLRVALTVAIAKSGVNA